MRLRALDPHGPAILSAYLDLDPARQLHHGYRAAFEDLVRELRERIAEPERAALSAEAERVARWLDESKPRGKGLAVFASAGRALLQTHVLGVRVRDHLAFEPVADVAPLLEALDEHERYAVALIDQKHARLFTVFLGEIEELEAFADSVPHKQHRGGWSQQRFQRRHAAHVLQHLERVTEALSEISSRRGFDRLILAGPEQATSELLRRLPRALERRVAGVIGAELGASTAEILQKTLEVERLAHLSYEQRLLEALVESRGHGARAVCGVAETLDALWADEVLKLVVAEGVHAEGSECGGCRRLARDAPPICPACGGKPERVHNLLHRAVMRAVQQAAGVQMLYGEAAQRLVELGEGLGALLRYRA